MISNLDELMRYTEVVANKFPTIASEIKLCSPGFSEDKSTNLSSDVAELPSDYLEIAKKINLFGVSIGRLALWPVPYGRGSYTASLIEANTDVNNPFLDLYKINDLVEVARLEANVITLGRNAAKNEGQVFLVDVSSGPEPVVQKLANSFEQLLLLAGNLHEICMSYEDDEESGAREFSIRLNKLGLERCCESIWNELLEEELL